MISMRRIRAVERFSARLTSEMWLNGTCGARRPRLRSTESLA